MQIERLDHLVLTVAEIPRTCDSSKLGLGLEVITCGEGRTALRFDEQKDQPASCRQHPWPCRRSGTSLAQRTLTAARKVKARACGLDRLALQVPPDRTQSTAAQRAMKWI